MPNTREKLIELLADSEYMSYEKKADHLIANGVTFREHDCHWATEQAYKNGYEAGKPKWIPVTERLPEEDGEYLTMTNANGKNNGVMSQRYRTTFLRGQQVRRWYWCTNLSPWKITHWMPLPEPPKGE